LAGGGVASIAFLVAGEKRGGEVPGNANPTDVTCTYWVSTVQHEITIAPKDYSTGPDPVLPPDGEKLGIPGPQFEIQVRKNITSAKKITVFSTQIQYSQTVMLDFFTLKWPHVSVATLAPALPILVPVGDPALAPLLT